MIVFIGRDMDKGPMQYALFSRRPLRSPSEKLTRLDSPGSIRMELTNQWAKYLLQDRELAVGEWAEIKVTT